jgi:hypothetical protein
MLTLLISPGRFFAAYQVKLVMAQIALYYDIEPIVQRPETQWFVNSFAPDLATVIRVKRRAGTVDKA